MINRRSFLRLMASSALFFSPGYKGSSSAFFPKEETAGALKRLSFPKSAYNTSFLKNKVKNPNIIVIVIDTLRADHLPVYGYERNTSPALSDFADTSVVFSNAIAPAPWTLPSFTSILLGQYAFNHDQNLPPGSRPQGTLLSSAIGTAGYRTVSIQTNKYVQWLDKKFDEVYHFFDKKVDSDSTVINFDQTEDGLDEKAVNKAIDWLDTRSNRRNKFFMFLGLISPHWRYKTNNGFLEDFVMDDLYRSSDEVDVDIKNGETRGITYDDLPDCIRPLVGSPSSDASYYKDSRLYTAAYDSEIKYADWQVGRLLETLKEYDLFNNSLIVILSDHGEDMVDHKPYFAHAENLYQSLLHVPLMIKFPKQTSRVSVEDHVRTIDLFPTIFDYVGLKTGISTDGKSLLPALSGQEVDYEERPVLSYVEYEGQGKSLSLIKDGYKFLLIMRDDGNYYKLFDLESDPGETNNIAKKKDNYSLIQSFKEYLSQYYSFE